MALDTTTVAGAARNVTHGGSIAFEDDRARDLELRRLGYRVHRFSETQLELEPVAVAEDVVRAFRR